MKNIIYKNKKLNKSKKWNKNTNKPLWSYPKNFAAS